jgi:CxxC motif-containing protein (DUF1111 family)
VEKLEKLILKAASTVQANRLTFKVGNCLFQNLWRKPHIAFLELIEGS